MALMSNNMLFLINSFGTEVTLRQQSLSAYDPTTGSTSVDSTTDTTAKCYFADYALSEVDNDSIILGDRKALLPHVDTSNNSLPTPEIGDTIIGLGDTVKVVRVQELYSANEIVCYICQVRE